jgi:unsaturated chondroitin disaccharide hydrolase
MKYWFSVLFTCLLLSNNAYNQSSKPSKTKLDKLVDSAITKSLLCLRNSVNEVKDPTLYPTYATKDLHWKIKSSADWTSGFYPGCLWYAYQLSNDAQFKQWAIDWTASIEKQKYNLKTHDLGFRFGCSFVKGLNLAPNDIATKAYKEIILTAANTMDKRFYPLIGAYTSDWDFKPLPNSVPVVIDIMMNLEMLLWTAQNGGDTARINRCKTHVTTSYRDLIRKDGSSYHIARYDSTTGKLLQQGQLQGDVDESTWTRGHAWMIYGLVTVYRFTKEEQYLQKAIQVTDYFLNHLPKDKIAPWDFQSTIAYKDASASAIVCSALLELQGYLRDARQKKYYLSQAQKILASLCKAPYFSEGKGTNCLLLHSTQYYHRTENTDVPCSFAD